MKWHIPDQPEKIKKPPLKPRPDLAQVDKELTELYKRMHVQTMRIWEKWLEKEKV